MDEYNPLDKSKQATHSEPESGWAYLGSAKITKAVGRITPPDALYKDAEILDQDGTAYWSYDKITGTLILSNDELEELDYNTVDESTIYGPNNSYAINIPDPFFMSYEAQPEGVPNNARVEGGERYHFVYNEAIEMHVGETRSCFLLTDDELMNRVKDAGNLSREFNSAPQFL